MYDQLLEETRKYQTCSVSELSRDLKRMLRIQLKEFIHHVEDLQGSVVRIANRQSGVFEVNSHAA